MSIYIKGMEMPSDCGKCFVGDRTICQQGCPLIELPEHGRLGDLDRLEQMFADIDNAPYSGFDGEEPFYSAEDAARIIRLAPTIIPADGGEP